METQRHELVVAFEEFFSKREVDQYSRDLHFARQSTGHEINEACGAVGARQSRVCKIEAKWKYIITVAVGGVSAVKGAMFEDIR